MDNLCLTCTHSAVVVVPIGFGIYCKNPKKGGMVSYRPKCDGYEKAESNAKGESNSNNG